MRKNHKLNNKEIAKYRIKYLFDLINKTKDDNYKDKYSEMIIKLARKYRLKLSSEEKLKICKKCFKYQIKEKNIIRRLKKGKIIHKCAYCGNIRRVLFKN